MIGTTLGHYQITSQLGKGGMGEVFQAKDQALGRDVAIKVLPEEFARDTDRVARFQREAKLLASLNHPNIAAIYGLEASDETDFLVLELVDGQTLADRIKAGPIPVEEALKLALQIAEALEAAHEKGVIHRDLKPSNIKVTPDHKVKVLDFGLAKAYAGDREEVNLSNSPTLSDLATQQGIILGTAAYMSPEQAKGKAVDKRADIWAFGVVLFEMLTGRQVFTGETVSDTLASVLAREPKWQSLPSNLHPRIRLLLERCLKKEPKDRYGVINDARVDIQEVLADPSGVFVQLVTTAEPRTKLRTMLPWVAAAIVVASIITGVAVWKLKAPEPRQVMRFEYELPEGQQIIGLAVSPDGKQFVYGTSNGLFIRSVEALTAKLIAGTEGATQRPFFSPDGKWIGYFSGTDRQLKKISINGGAPITLCAFVQFWGAWWDADNTIVCSGVSGVGGPVLRISADGGTPKAITKREPKGHLFPQILPDGKSVLYTAFASPTTQGKVMVQPFQSGEPKELLGAMWAQYLPTGHLIFALRNNSNLFAIAFDPDKLEVKGGPVSVVEDASQAAVSDAGTLVYIPETPGAAPQSADSPERTLVWVDRKGHEESLGAPLNVYRFPNISPDGTRVALNVSTATNSDIWVWDISRRTLTKLTFEGTGNTTPVWAPDSKKIAFFGTFQKAELDGLYWKAADGTGKNELIAPASRITGFFPTSWLRDGKIVGQQSQDNQTFNIGMISMEGDRKLKGLLWQDYQEVQPKISPDGRWMAYTSTESGKHEIYVRSFPDVNKGRWQISTNGGDSPLWSPDGRELFYLNGDAAMAVSVTAEPSFSTVGIPKLLFRGAYVTALPNNGTPWDISPDGKRFLMMKESPATGDQLKAFTSTPTAPVRQKINIVLNWFEELKQRVPVK